MRISEVCNVSFLFHSYPTVQALRWAACLEGFLLHLKLLVAGSGTISVRAGLVGSWSRGWLCWQILPQRVTSPSSWCIHQRSGVYKESTSKAGRINIAFFPWQNASLGFLEGLLVAFWGRVVLGVFHFCWYFFFLMYIEPFRPICSCSSEIPFLPVSLLSPFTPAYSLAFFCYLQFCLNEFGLLEIITEVEAIKTLSASAVNANPTNFAPAAVVSTASSADLEGELCAAKASRNRSNWNAYFSSGVLPDAACGVSHCLIWNIFRHI